MREELDKKLCEDFPKMFVNRHKSMKETCMCWGFDHGDGWYNIIRALCSNIQHHIDWQRKQRAGALKYNRALRKALTKNDKSALIKHFSYSDSGPNEWTMRRVEEAIVEGKYREVPEACKQVVVDQVKEKFGTLRFYYSGGDDTIHGMTRMAESMSAVTCEVCGAPGKSRHGGWVHTYCDHHEEEYQQRMKERYNGED